jgi:hypothetical protein
MLKLQFLQYSLEALKAIAREILTFCQSLPLKQGQQMVSAVSYGAEF